MEIQRVKIIMADEVKKRKSMKMMKVSWEVEVDVERGKGKLIKLLGWRTSTKNGVSWAELILAEN